MKNLVLSLIIMVFSVSLTLTNANGNFNINNNNNKTSLIDNDFKEKSILFKNSEKINFNLKLNNNNNHYNDEFKFGPAAMIAGAAFVGFGYFTYLRQRRVTSNNSQLGHIDNNRGGPLSNISSAFPIIVGGSLVITGGIATITGN